MEPDKLKNIVEAALLAAGEPLNLDQLQRLFAEQEPPARDALREALKRLTEDYEGRGIEIKEVGSGFRIQTRGAMSEWVSRLWEERPPRYSRALLETLALIAYRQPITRGEIEEIRGVSVSTNIVKTLLEREWVRVVGHRDVPGKPAMYGTTKQFLDYFNIKNLNELPTLAEIRDIDSINAELVFEEPTTPQPEPDPEPEPEQSGNTDPITEAANDPSMSEESETEQVVEAADPLPENVVAVAEPEVTAQEP